MLRTRQRLRGSIGNKRLSAFGIVPNLCFQLDATIAASYPGTGQTYSNIITSPSDGTSQTGYDFWLGADGTVGTDDPTFTGSANSPSAYFAHDGGDHFLLKSNTTFINDFCRTDQTGIVYMAATFQLGSVAAVQWILGNTTSAVNRGFRLDVNATPVFRFTRADGTTAFTTTIPGTPTAGGTYLAVFVYDKSAQTFKSAINSRTFTTTAVAATTNTVSASAGFAFAGAANGASKLSAGSRTYGVLGGTGDVSNAQLSSLVDYYNFSYGRTFA